MSDTKTFKIVADTKGAEKGLKKTSTALKGVGKSGKVAGKGFKVMGTAMKAMGIGLIIAVVAKLTDMLMKNQKIQDLVARVTDTLGKVIGVLVDIMFEALKVIDKLTFGMLNLSGEADGATKSLQKQRNEYELLEAGMEKIKLQYETQIEKLRQIRDNEHLTMEERIAASDAIAKTLDKQYATERERILEMIQVKKNLLKADRHNVELKKELLAVETMLAELDNRITSQRSEQLQSLNSLKSEQLNLSNKSTTAIKKEVKSVEEMIEALDKYGSKLQKTDEQIHNENLKNMEEEFYAQINEIRERNGDKRKTEFDKDIKYTKNVISNQEKTLSKLYSQLGKATSEAQKERIRKDIEGYRETLEAFKKNLLLLQDAREKDIRNQGAYSQDEEDLLEFYQKKKKQIIDDYNKKVADTAKKEADRIRNINKEAMRVAREDLLTDFQREYQAIQDKYAKILEQTELGEAEIAAIKERQRRDEQELEDRYEEDEAKKRADRNAQLVDAAVGLANALTSISRTRANNQIADLERQFKNGEITEKQYNDRKNKIEEQQAKKEKAAALLQIGVDTARGVSGAVAAGAGLVFPANLAAIATGVLAVIAGIAQASAVLGAQPEGIDPDTDDDGGDEDSEEVIANLVPTYGIAGSDQAPVQAYVVESDVSSSQALQNDLNLQATL